tara:strand:- start:9104 stop:9511 length:408 start_codon:yes stop_codon:yes gene_type:complete
MAEIKWLTNGLVDSGDATAELPPDALEKSPEMTAPVEKENPMKEWLVEYVGGILNPADGNVTTEMIIHAMSIEFPEFLLALAEENWMRGYAQALHDAEKGLDLLNNGDIVIGGPPTESSSEVEIEAPTTEDDTKA